MVSKDTTTLRADKKIAGVSVEIAKKRGMTVKAYTTKALEELNNFYKYSYEALVDEIENQNLLKLNKDFLKKTLKNIEWLPRKSLINLLQKGYVEYLDFSRIDLDKKINLINKEKYNEVIVFLRINPKISPPNDAGNLLRETYDKIEKITCKHSLFLYLDASLDQEFRFLVFLLKKEKGEKKENGKL